MTPLAYLLAPLICRAMLYGVQQFRFLTPIAVLFVTVLLVSNVASTKLTEFWGLTLDAGTLLFPLSYIFGDVLTEVYGFLRARAVIWLGFGATLLASGVFILVGMLPPSPDWGNQEAYLAILGLTPRIVVASLIAYLVGSFMNSIVLAKMKVWMDGRHLWMRTIGSTLVGQLLDTALFILIAFTGIFSGGVLVALIVSNYIFKVAVEALFTPVTYAVVAYLKRAESIDHYDRGMRFSPWGN